MFACGKCGHCCRSLDKSPIYAELDGGNGICKYLDGNLCSVYSTRPLLCRVDESYEVYFKNVMSRVEYEKINHDFCVELGFIMQGANKKH